VCRFGEPGKVRYKFTLVEWAQRPEVVKAWKELAEKYDLMDKQFRDVERVFSFTDAALGWSQNIYFRSVIALFLFPAKNTPCPH